MDCVRLTATLESLDRLLIRSANRSLLDSANSLYSEANVEIQASQTTATEYHSSTLQFLQIRGWVRHVDCSIGFFRALANSHSQGYIDRTA